MWSGGYFPPRYFAGTYWPRGEGATAPTFADGACFATAAVTATATGDAVSSQPPLPLPLVTGGGGRKRGPYRVPVWRPTAPLYADAACFAKGSATAAATASGVASGAAVATGAAAATATGATRRNYAPTDNAVWLMAA